MVDIVGMHWDLFILCCVVGTALILICLFLIAVVRSMFLRGWIRVFEFIWYALMLAGIAAIYMVGIDAISSDSMKYTIKTYDNPVIAVNDGYEMSDSLKINAHIDVLKDKISKVSGVDAIGFDNDADIYEALGKGELVDFIGVKNDAKFSGSVYFTKDKMIVLLDKDKAKEQERFEVETK